MQIPLIHVFARNYRCSFTKRLLAFSERNVVIPADTRNTDEWIYVFYLNKWMYSSLPLASIVGIVIHLCTAVAQYFCRRHRFCRKTCSTSGCFCCCHTIFARKNDIHSEVHYSNVPKLCHGNYKVLLILIMLISPHIWLSILKWRSVAQRTIDGETWLSLS